MLPTASGGGPFALDGTPVAGNTSSANLALTGFSTIYTNDVIVLAVITNGSTLSSSFSTGGLTFNREPGLTPPSSGSGTTLDLFTAISAAAVSGATTFTVPNSAAFTTGLLFALSGAKTSAPFDVNALIPSVTNTNTVPAKITTTASNIFAFGMGVIGTTSPGSGYTNMDNGALAGVLCLNYKLTAAGPLAADVWNTVNTSGSIATAIVVGP